MSEKQFVLVGEDRKLVPNVLASIRAATGRPATDDLRLPVTLAVLLGYKVGLEVFPHILAKQVSALCCGGTPMGGDFPSMAPTVHRHWVVWEPYRDDPGDGEWRPMPVSEGLDFLAPYIDRYVDSMMAERNSVIVGAVSWTVRGRDDQHNRFESKSTRLGNAVADVLVQMGHAGVRLELL